MIRCSLLSSFQGLPWKIIFLIISRNSPPSALIPTPAVMWYVAQACIALNVSFDEVIEGNVKKLMKRYPGGDFDVYYSENRAEDDR
jgi:hypothetical protein